MAMLSLLLLIPFLGCLLLALWPGHPAPGLMRKVALGVLFVQVANCRNPFPGSGGSD
jgi:hypothetical protein